MTELLCVIAIIVSLGAIAFALINTKYVQETVDNLHEYVKNMSKIDHDYVMGVSDRVQAFYDASIKNATSDRAYMQRVSDHVDEMLVVMRRYADAKDDRSKAFVTLDAQQEER